MPRLEIFIVFLFIGYVRNDDIVSKEEYAVLPKIFGMDDIEACPKGNLYCKCDIILTPINKTNPPDLWMLIEKVNSSIWHYRRDFIFRGMCVAKENIGLSYDGYLQQGLEGRIVESYCTEMKKPIVPNKIDLLLGSMMTIYIIFLIYCTKKTRKEINGKPVNVSKYIKIFSVENTWKDLRKPKSKEFPDLLCIQGIRTVAMCLIILIHTYAFNVSKFSHNPEYMESFGLNTYSRILIAAFSLFVQIFFVISSWLLAIQLNKVVERNGNINLKDAMILIVNRYVRLVPSVIYFVLLYASDTIIKIIMSELYISVGQTDSIKAGKSWWKVLLFIQNVGDSFKDSCAPFTWFIAADMQMYFMFTVFFYLSQSLKIPMKYGLSLIVGTAVIIQGHTVMTSDFSGLFYMGVRNLPPEKLSSIPAVMYSYCSTVCNIATYAIGFTFGFIYSKNRNRNIFNSPLKKLAWLICFLGLPVIASWVHSYEYFGIMKVITAVTLRPIFGLGIAIGIFGMTTKTGGVIKKVFESDLLVFLGNFTYSVYMFHFLVYGRTLHLNQMTDNSTLHFMTDYVLNVIASFALGIYMYMIVEYPCIQLQKLLLPQVKYKTPSQDAKSS